MRTAFNPIIYLILFCFLLPASFLYGQEEQVYIKSLAIDEYIDFYNEEQQQYVTLSDFLVIMDNTIHVKATASTENLLWSIQVDLNGDGNFSETIFEDEMEGFNLNTTVELSENIISASINNDITFRILAHDQKIDSMIHPCIEIKSIGPIHIGNASRHEEHDCLQSNANSTILYIYNTLEDSIEVQLDINSMNTDANNLYVRSIYPSTPIKVGSDDETRIRVIFNRKFGLTKKFLLGAGIKWQIIDRNNPAPIMRYFYDDTRYEVCQIILEEPDSDYNMRTIISPNPFTNTATVSYFVPEGSIVNLVTIELYNLQGILVQSILNQVPHTSGDYRATIGGLSLDSGTYLVKIQIGEDIKTYQVTKH